MDRDSDSSSDSDSEEEEDEEDSDSEAVVPGRPQPKGSKPKSGAEQASKLYGEIGQFNPHAARAERKTRRKEKKVRLGDDFDFAEAFADEVQLEGEEGQSGSDAVDMSSGDEVPE